MRDYKDKSIGIRFLGALCSIVLLAATIGFIVYGMTTLNSILMLAAIIGAVTPNAVSGGSVFEIITGTFETMIEGFVSIVEGIFDAISSIFS